MWGGNAVLLVPQGCDVGGSAVQWCDKAARGGSSAVQLCHRAAERQRRYSCAIRAPRGPSSTVRYTPECYWCPIKHEDEEFIEEYDYYLFRAPVQSLTGFWRTAVDSYGQVFPGDSWVIKGHYFTLAGNNHGESIDQGHGLYVWSKRTAIVWAAS
jgi:hypothetical protein